MNTPHPDRANYVIIGGGAVGCGVAYSLAKAGKTGILLIDRALEPGQVTTSQGAGFCGQIRSSVERTQLAMHSVAVFREMQLDPEIKPDWHEVGSLRISLNEGRTAEFRQLKIVADQAGLESSFLAPPDAQRLWPALDFSLAHSVLWCPSDGYMTPKCVAKSYEHQSRKLGVQFAFNTALQEIVVRQGQIEGILTNRRPVQCRNLINAAGAHAYHVALAAGLELPIVPVRHEYYVTIPLPGLHPSLPCLRIPDLTLYARAADDTLLLGGWETQAVHLDPRAYALSEMAPEIIPDAQVLQSFEDRFARLFPSARAAPRARIAKGWPTFTPDGHFIIGESSKIKGFIMAGGCNAHGISGSAGIGRLLVQSLFDPSPSNYVRGLSPDRFTNAPWNWSDARRSAARVYETYYGLGC